jgi:predicted transcriptional regulator
MEPIKTYKNHPTQQELADEMGVTQGYVSHLIKGIRKTKKRIKQLNEILEKRMKAA